MNKSLIISLLVLLALLSGCTTKSDVSKAKEPASLGDGIYDGALVGFSIVGNLLEGNRNYVVYNKVNDGNNYNAGFMIGLLIFFSSSGSVFTRTTSSKSR